MQVELTPQYVSSISQQMVTTIDDDGDVFQTENISTWCSPVIYMVVFINCCCFCLLVCERAPSKYGACYRLLSTSLSLSV